jgi:hypothetical protein
MKLVDTAPLVMQESSSPAGFRSGLLFENYGGKNKNACVGHWDKLPLWKTFGVSSERPEIV